MVTKIQRTRATEQRIPMRYAEFLAAYPEGIHAEWVQGEGIIFMPPTIHHQRMVMFLSLLMGFFVSKFELGDLLVAPSEMRLPDQQSAREPDILFVAARNADRLTAQRLMGPADLVVEVISDESVTRDHVDKWREYQAAGVREYWIIDPRPGHQAAHFWALDEYARYQTIPLTEAGVFHSRILPGFWLDTNWLQSEELPNALQCFMEIVGPDALRAPET